MTTPVGALIGRGLAHHRRGELVEAAALYALALALAPDDAEALNLSAVVSQQQGDFAASVEPLQRAVRLKPEARYYTNLANALNQLGRAIEAETAAREAVRRDARSAAAHCNLAIALRTLERLPEAASTFRAAIALQPGYADAYANLGVVLTELGEPERAQAVLQRAVALNPGAAEPWFNLGNALLRLARWDEAAAAFQAALELRPAYGEAQANLGAARKAQGRLEEAGRAYAAAATLWPGSVVAHHNLGLVLGELNRHEEATAALEQAAALSPEGAASASVWMDFGNALYGLAKTRTDASALAIYDHAIATQEAARKLDPDVAAVHYNLGLAYLGRGRVDDAVASFEAALALHPDYAEAHCNLGHSLAELGRFAPAIAACERALALNPRLAEAQSTLGNIFVGQNRLVEAEAAYRRSIALRPDMAGGYCNLGVSLFRQGCAIAALDAYDEALRLEPGLADAHWNRALVLLQRGDFAAGWPEYEWRLRRSRRIRSDAHLATPLWTGEPLEGRTILLHAEQGLGDAIQCVRFAPSVAERGGAVILQAPDSLMRLFASVPGAVEVVASDAPVPRADRRLPLFSLPGLFAPSPDHLAWPGLADPAPRGAYLSADPEEADRWAERLDERLPGDALRIGVVWSGNRTSEVELGRSIPLEMFAPLAARPEVRLISLQKGHGLEQLEAPPAEMKIIQLGAAYDDGDFSTTAAVMENLDLIVSCDTSAAHLAGALGRPVWLAVNAVADWRWMEQRVDSPWYPSLRLYRQSRPGDWTSVFQAMAGDLGRRRVRHAPERRRLARRSSPA